MRSAFLVAVVALAAASQGCQRATAVAPSPRVASVACLTGVGVQVAPPEILSPQAAGGGDDDDDGGTTAIHPCKAHTPEHAAATDAVSALADRVRDLADDGDPTPVEEELEALLATTCFQLSQGDEHPDLEMDSALALKSWWEDGGERWIEHYLSLDDLRLSVVPPSPRRSLTTAKPRAPKTAGAARVGHADRPGDDRASPGARRGRRSRGASRRRSTIPPSSR